MKSLKSDYLLKKQKEIKTKIKKLVVRMAIDVVIITITLGMIVWMVWELF